MNYSLPHALRILPLSTISTFSVHSVFFFLVCLFFFIRTSNFGAEAEPSYIFFCDVEAENVLKMFLNYMVYNVFQ